MKQSQQLWYNLNHEVSRTNTEISRQFLHEVVQICCLSVKTRASLRFIWIQTDISTALYSDFVCCCLPEFKVNPLQTVTAMSALRACACACASVPCRSSPFPTVGRQSVLCLGTMRSAHTSQTSWTLGIKRAQARYGLPGVSVPLSNHRCIRIAIDVF